MYYAPYLSYADLGIDTGSKQEPILVNPDANALGDGKGPFEYLITPLNQVETLKIRASGQALLKRLEEYKPYFKVNGIMSNHRH
jgi:hypothetical protein